MCYIWWQFEEKNFNQNQIYHRFFFKVSGKDSYSGRSGRIAWNITLIYCVEVTAVHILLICLCRISSSLTQIFVIKITYLDVPIECQLQVDLWAWEQGCRLWDTNSSSSLGTALFAGLCSWLLTNPTPCPCHSLQWQRGTESSVSWSHVYGIVNTYEFPMGTSERELTRAGSTDTGKEVYARYKSSLLLC